MTSQYLTHAQMARIIALKEKRNKLKNHIDTLKSRSHPDYYLKQLKVQNLLLKDEIASMEHKVANA